MPTVNLTQSTQGSTKPGATAAAYATRLTLLTQVGGRGKVKTPPITYSIYFVQICRVVSTIVSRNAAAEQHMEYLYIAK